MRTIEIDISRIPIAGIQAMTTIDFPGRIAAVFFTSGCPWNCRYCHNPALRNGGAADIISTDDIDSFLRERQGFIDGIVMSGGEPTLHIGLPDFLRYIRSFGYTTAIHTNGYYPRRLKNILMSELVDYVALDVKAPPKLYDRVTGSRDACVAVSRSIKHILSSGVDYEFRTTWHPDILSEDELLDTVRVVASVGAKRYFLQEFQRQGVTDTALLASNLSAAIPAHISEEAHRLFPEYSVR